MFEYRCPSCGVAAYSSASYATVGICPSCESPLADDAFATVSEPDPIAATGRLIAAVGKRETLPAARPVAGEG
jgi:hypothetical protein